MTPVVFILVISHSMYVPINSFCRSRWFKMSLSVERDQSRGTRRESSLLEPPRKDRNIVCGRDGFGGRGAGRPSSISSFIFKVRKEKDSYRGRKVEEVNERRIRDEKETKEAEIYIYPA